jgi:outer membrane protein assembly factor BamD
MKRAVLITALCLTGCKTLGSFFGSEVGEPTYASDADTNLQRGDEQLASKNYLEAQKYFDFVKSKFPYLEAATTAELRLGDVDFEREKYVEARDRYLNFIKLHPTHAKVDYAAFRAAMSHFKDIPSDFFLLPPASEKDQAEVRAASIAMADFIRSYPNSEYVAQAQKVYDDVKKRLAQHELYVADFYRKREKWNAVVGRLSVVEKDYGGLGYEERVYFGLYDAYRKLKDDTKAKEALQMLVAKYPDTPAAKKAQAVLAK